MAEIPSPAPSTGTEAEVAAPLAGDVLAHILAQQPEAIAQLTDPANTTPEQLSEIVLEAEDAGTVDPAEAAAAQQEIQNATPEELEAAVVQAQAAAAEGEPFVLPEVPQVESVPLADIQLPPTFTLASVLRGPTRAVRLEAAKELYSDLSDQEAGQVADFTLANPNTTEEALQSFLDDLRAARAEAELEQPPAAPEFVGQVGQGNQRRKNKYICVGGRNRVAANKVKVGKGKKTSWRETNFNAFNAQDYWREMENWKNGVAGAVKPRLPKLYYLSEVNGRVRRNDLTENQKQRCLGLLPPCKGDNCPGELAGSKRRESTLQGKRRINISDRYLDKLTKGQVPEPPRIIGCLEADDDYAYVRPEGGLSQGDATPFRSFDVERDPITKKLRPLPPPDYPIDVCEPDKFQDWLRGDAVHGDKPQPGETITQSIVNRENRQFSSGPFEVSLFYMLLRMMHLLRRVNARDNEWNARFIQKLMEVQLPGDLKKFRQLYIEPEHERLIVPADQSKLKVDLSGGERFFDEHWAYVRDQLAPEFEAAVGQGAGEALQKLVLGSFGNRTRMVNGRSLFTLNLESFLRGSLSRPSILPARQSPPVPPPLPPAIAPPAVILDLPVIPIPPVQVPQAGGPVSPGTPALMPPLPLPLAIPSPAPSTSEELLAVEEEVEKGPPSEGLFLPGSFGASQEELGPEAFAAQFPPPAPEEEESAAAKSFSEQFEAPGTPQQEPQEGPPEELLPPAEAVVEAAVEETAPENLPEIELLPLAEQVAPVGTPSPLPEPQLLSPGQL